MLTTVRGLPVSVIGASRAGRVGTFLLSQLYRAVDAMAVTVHRPLARIPVTGNFVTPSVLARRGVDAHHTTFLVLRAHWFCNFPTGICGRGSNHTANTWQNMWCDVLRLVVCCARGKHAAKHVVCCQCYIRGRRQKLLYRRDNCVTSNKLSHPCTQTLPPFCTPRIVSPSCCRVLRGACRCREAVGLGVSWFENVQWVCGGTQIGILLCRIFFRDLHSRYRKPGWPTTDAISISSAADTWPGQGTKPRRYSSLPGADTIGSVTNS